MKNIKHNIVISILVTIFICTLTLNYFQHNKLVIQRKKIKNNFVANDLKRKIKEERYSEILKEIEEKKGVEIKNITKKDEGNKVTIDVDFKGKSGLLDAFLKDIKTKENLYKVSLIEMEKQGENIYNGSLILKFIV